MYQTRVIPNVRLFFVIIVKKNLIHYPIIHLRSATSAHSHLVNYSTRNIHPEKPLYTTVNKILDFPSKIVQKVWGSMGKFDFFNINKYRFRALGYFLYEEMSDTLDRKKFYKELRMPDTFFSWFVVTELHVWMMMVRCMAEGKEGQVLRNNIVQAMWDDVNGRSKLLRTKEQPVNEKILKKQIILLSQQFNAAIIAYDEGITGDDKILSGALWRRFFLSECNDPEMLEKLVYYLRKQTCILDKTPWRTFLQLGTVKWQGLDLIKEK